MIDKINEIKNKIKMLFAEDAPAESTAAEVKEYKTSDDLLIQVDKLEVGGKAMQVLEDGTLGILEAKNYEVIDGDKVFDVAINAEGIITEIKEKEVAVEEVVVEEEMSNEEKIENVISELSKEFNELITKVKAQFEKVNENIESIKKENTELKSAFEKIADEPSDKAVKKTETSVGKVDFYSEYNEARKKHNR